MAHDVFISYSTQDRNAANAVCAKLESAGIRCWIAPRDILPGRTWGGAIMRAISETRVMVLIFSANANASPQILREVERAVSRGVVVVPIRIEDVIPVDDLEYFISSQHWLDALTPPLDAHLDRITRVIEQVVHEQAGLSAEGEGRPAPRGGWRAGARPSGRERAGPEVHGPAGGGADPVPPSRSHPPPQPPPPPPSGPPPAGPPPSGEARRAAAAGAHAPRADGPTRVSPHSGEARRGVPPPPPRPPKEGGGIPTFVKVAGIVVGALLMLAAGIVALVVAWPEGGGRAALPPTGCADASAFAAFGPPIFGELTDDDALLAGSHADFYAIYADRAEYVDFVLESAEFDPFLRLYDSTMVELATDDDGGGGLSSRISMLLSPGCYLVGVEALSGAGEGAYTLTPGLKPRIPNTNAFLVGIRLFGSGKGIPEFDDRVYASTFPSATAQYVNVELELERDVAGTVLELPVQCTYYRPDGSVDGNLEWTLEMQADWTGSFHANGWGSETPPWSPGTYRVVCTVRGSEAVETSFLVE